MSLMPPPRRYSVLFRTDASIQIGTGHVMRCLTLANMLAEAGFLCRFVCRAHPGNLTDLIRQRGFAVTELPREVGDRAETAYVGHTHWLGADWQTDACETASAIGDARPDLLIVDHYAIDSRWERSMRPFCSRLIVLDDLADREHDCDLLLDQNLGRTASDYLLLVPANCEMLIGASFALLRPEFALKRPYSLARRRSASLPRRLLVTLGGIDKDNVTRQVLDALERCTLPPDMEITIVMGQHAPWAKSVREKAAQLPWNAGVVFNVDDMAGLMSGADLAIGAAGSTSWERCALGLPTVLMVLAENQRSVARILDMQGAAKLVELGPDFVSVFRGVVEGLVGNKTALEAMSERAATICDGKGGLEVVRAITDRLCCRI
ncbi:UDP-2,4-diacetamido-2,4,6-trideoxy-beta-L-altropyranose hydrolase [Sinorhizobium meliloti]|nr:UDP-2,4-diacetamido-2,4,6-trideoxy-beta-L-altropyranose hydrolase [Sinorhizobium meliloti]